MSLLYNIYLEIDDLHLYIYLYRTVFLSIVVSFSSSVVLVLAVFHNFVFMNLNRLRISLCYLQYQ